MKDSDLITFTNETIGELRGFMKDGEPWFLAGQVCGASGSKDVQRNRIEDGMKIAEVEGTICITYPFRYRGSQRHSNETSKRL